MTKISDQKIDELRRLLGNSTSGPWGWSANGELRGRHGILVAQLMYGFDDRLPDSDEQLIEAMDPDTVGELIDEIDRLRAMAKKIARIVGWPEDHQVEDPSELLESVAKVVAERDLLRDDAELLQRRAGNASAAATAAAEAALRRANDQGFAIERDRDRLQARLIEVLAERDAIQSRLSAAAERIAEVTEQRDASRRLAVEERGRADRIVADAEKRAEQAVAERNATQAELDEALMQPAWPETRPYPDVVTSRRTWTQFREAGMLWWANRVLHVFGWVIVVQEDTDTGEIVGAEPRRASWRGFSEVSEDRGFRRVTAWMRDNAVQLRREVEFDDAPPEVDGAGEARGLAEAMNGAREELAEFDAKHGLMPEPRAGATPELGLARVTGQAGATFSGPVTFENSDGAQFRTAGVALWVGDSQVAIKADTLSGLLGSATEALIALELMADEVAAGAARANDIQASHYARIRVDALAEHLDVVELERAASLGMTGGLREALRAEGLDPDHVSEPVAALAELRRSKREARRAGHRGVRAWQSTLAARGPEIPTASDVRMRINAKVEREAAEIVRRAAEMLAEHDAESYSLHLQDDADPRAIDRAITELHERGWKVVQITGELMIGFGDEDVPF